MSVLNTEIKFYTSQHEGRGGPVTTTEIISNAADNIFPAVSGKQAFTGAVEHKCIYVKNINPLTQLQDARAYLSQLPTNGQVVMELGAGASQSGQIEPVSVSPEANPLGVVFALPTSPDSAIDLGTIGPLEAKALWIKRTVLQHAAATDHDTFVITVYGDTT